MRTYNQGSTGTCTGFAFANAVELATGIELKRSEVFDYFEKYYALKKGMQIRQLLQRVTKDPIRNSIRLDEVDDIFIRARDQVLPTPFFLKKVKESERDNSRMAFIIVLRINNKAPAIVFDENYFYVQGPKRSKHALCISSYNREKGYFVIENSWGRYWGDKGSFKLKRQELIRHVEEVWMVKFR